MKTTPADTASFCPYTLDLRSGELRKFGVRVKMGEQPFRYWYCLKFWVNWCRAKNFGRNFGPTTRLWILIMA